MEKSLLSIHQLLAYLIFIVAIADVVLVLTKARSDARLATILHWCHTLGVIWAGRIALVVGMALWHSRGWGVGTWWIWVSLACWGPAYKLSRCTAAGTSSSVAQKSHGIARRAE